MLTPPPPPPAGRWMFNEGELYSALNCGVPRFTGVTFMLGQVCWTAARGAHESKKIVCRYTIRLKRRLTENALVGSLLF